MTALPRFLDYLPIFHSRDQRNLSGSKEHSLQGQPAATGSKSLSKSKGAHLTDSDVLADVVVHALWASFPKEATEDGIANAACRHFLNRRGKPISPRTVTYWLRRETLPSAVHLSRLVLMQPKMFLTFWRGLK